MKTLPNGLIVFNATPHPIQFWDEGWEGPVVVESDEVINATIEEEVFSVEEYGPALGGRSPNKVTFVKTVFVSNDEGSSIADEALDTADVVVGSIIAAQAYPKLVCALCPAPGYERTPDPAQRRYSASKFVLY